MPITQQRKGSILLIDGLDVSNPAEYISDHASPSSENFEVDQGLLCKRTGSVARGLTLSEEIMLGTEFTREQSKYNVRVGLTKIQKDNNGTWADIGHTDFTGSTDDLFSMAIPLLSGKQILVVGNGIDAPYKWTASGNTTALGGSPPTAKYYQEFKTYLVAAHVLGGVDIDTRVQWSDTADPETWSTGNSGSTDLVEDGGEITGMSLYSNYLSIHKEQSIYLGYLVSTTAIFRFDRKATGAGTIANNSIVNLPTGEQLFLGSDGMRIFNGITAPLIEAPINEEIRDQLNQEKRHKAWSILVKEKDEAWMGIPIGSSEVGDTIYKFNYITRKLYKDMRSGASASWRAAQTSSTSWDNSVGTWDDQTERWNSGSLGSQFSLVYVGYNTGITLYNNSASTDDNGTAIEAFWESKDYEDEEKRISRWQQIQIWAKGGTLTVDYSTDEGQTWTAVSGSPFTLADTFPLDTAPVVGYLDALSSKARFRFTNNELAESLCIKQFIIGYVPREFRR